MKRKHDSRRGLRREGVVIALVALSLVAIMGVVAIAIDGGVLLNRRRDMQSAADAAAMAAACVLYSEFPQKQGVDSSNNAKYAAFVTALQNGYSHEGGRSTVTVNIPPLSGPYAGKASYAEVIITYAEPRYFSRTMGTDATNITARAVARGAWTSNGIGVLVLDYEGKAALNSQGNGSFTESG
jgi:uncharacterized membrane protein